MGTLYMGGAYRTSMGGEAKANKKELTALSVKTMKTANAGGDAQADLKKFIATAKITDQYNTPLTIWNPTQRRNAGAPTTDTVMATPRASRRATLLRRSTSEWHPRPVASKRGRQGVCSEPASLPDHYAASEASLQGHE